MVQSKKGMRLLICTCIACVIAMTCVLSGCGAGASQPIVGQWRLAGVSTENTEGVVSRTDGSATVSADGKFSMDLGSELKFSGSWEAVPKSDWLGTEVEGTIGEYELSSTLNGSGNIDLYAFVSKSNTGYQMFMFIEPDWNISIVFQRSS